MQPTRDKPGPDFSGTPDADQVRGELALILESPSFKSSKRCRDLLAYLVNNTLDQKPDAIDEKTMAIVVFEKDEGSQIDLGIVRVGAREVRKRLANYYEAEGQKSTVRIQVGERSYVPKFRALRPPVSEPLPVPKPVAPPPPPPPAPAVSRLVARPPLPPPAAKVAPKPQPKPTPPPPPAPPPPKVVKPDPKPVVVPPVVPPPVVVPTVVAPAPPPPPTPEPVAPPQAEKSFPWVYVLTAAALVVAAVIAYVSFHS